MFDAYFRKIEDPISSYTHFLGAIFSTGICFFWIIYGKLIHTSIPTILSLLAFGLALIGLYSASSYYHTLPHNHKYHALFRKLDHSMIYILIVGSYTPFIIAFYPNALITVIIMWLIAISGILLKIYYFHLPRWISTGLYILLGWSILFMPSIFSTMPKGCLILLALGGLAYTLGGFIYIIKKPNVSISWSFHEIFHILIMIGSFFHIIATTIYIL